MIKRTIPLLFAVAVMIVTAVPARANHCVRCQFFVDYSVCKWGTSFGSTDCDDSTGVCELIGESCRDFTASAVTPLSSDFQVASVERIDEAPAPNEALVAKLDAPKPATETAR